MFCTQCGTRISIEMKFCWSCGSNVLDDAETSKPSANTSVHAPGTAGQRRPQAHVPQPTISRGVPELDARATEHARRRRVKVASTSAAFALMLAGGGYWIWHYFTPGSGSTNATPVVRPVEQRDAPIATARNLDEQAKISDEQAQIAAAHAALDREIAAEESEARERVSRPAPK